MSREPPADRASNCFSGRIADSGYFGRYSVYRVTLAGGMKLQVAITHSERNGDLFVSGEEVYATCQPESLVVLGA
ncbi:MAG: hypothetical protein B7X10_05865 [Burkholderiales bacterium 21-58-4]|nr:MAG: hypothetical protein B7X10_05865 [Burkholderiales bacterium 21-58-4]